MKKKEIKYFVSHKFYLPALHPFTLLDIQVYLHIIQLMSDSGDEKMISLRQRTRSSDGYSRVSTDDEDDDVPTLTRYRSRKKIPKKSSSGCKITIRNSYCL